MAYTVSLPDGSTRTTTSKSIANAMAKNSGGTVSSSPSSSGGGSSSSGGGSSSSGGGSSSSTRWENRDINGATYTVPVGTSASWQPGQAFAGAGTSGKIDAPDFNHQQNTESVVGTNYTTNDNGTYSSNWDKNEQQRYNDAFQGYAQTNYPQYYEQEMARQAELLELERQRITELEKNILELKK